MQWLMQRQFGMYIMFPIGWMYYFGTNLDNKFTVKDFWPTKEQLNKIPTEREDIKEEVERMKNRRLMKRQLRLEEEGVDCEKLALCTPVNTAVTAGGPLDQMGDNIARLMQRDGRGWLEWARWR